LQTATSPKEIQCWLGILSAKNVSALGKFRRHEAFLVVYGATLLTEYIWTVWK